MVVSPMCHVPLLAALPRGEVDALAAMSPQRTYPTHTILFHEGDYGARFYLCGTVVNRTRTMGVSLRHA